MGTHAVDAGGRRIIAKDIDRGVGFGKAQADQVYIARIIFNQQNTCLMVSHGSPRQAVWRSEARILPGISRPKRNRAGCPAWSRRSSRPVHSCVRYPGLLAKW